MAHPKGCTICKDTFGGSVREVIDNFFLLSSDEAYEDAKSLLDKRYGDQFVVANAFRDKLDSWPKVNSRDSFGLRKFADLLRQCLAAMQDTEGLKC